MSEQIWLIDAVAPPDEEDFHHLARMAKPLFRGAKPPTPKTKAIRIQDIIIHDNKKWFGGADIRLDALTVHGYGNKESPDSFYMPGTFRFPGVADGERLPTGEKGLLVFHGKPLHFLDIFITVSRDPKDSDDLATLMMNNLGKEDMQGSLSALLGLAVADPTAAIIKTAFSAALRIGDLAYQILQNITGKTVGLYRDSWLHRDNFGLGRHPETGSHRIKDLSFWYEIVEDKD
jgi:hypothetical protein